MSHFATASLRAGFPVLAAALTAALATRLSPTPPSPRACQTKVDTGFVARHAEKQKVRVCLAILSSPDRL